VAPKARSRADAAQRRNSALRSATFGLQVRANGILEFSMTLLRRGVPALVAVLGLAAFAAAPAEAKVKRRHPAQTRHAPPPPAKFPVYVDKGSDRNPGGDDLYFNDTKQPSYLVGPGLFQRQELISPGGWFQRNGF
jgi:hypothetical protein